MATFSLCFVSIDLNFVSVIKSAEKPPNYLNSLSLAVNKTDRNDKKLAEREACVINIAAAAHYSIKQATRAIQQL